jgi:hypothetical protein
MIIGKLDVMTEELGGVTCLNSRIALMISGGGVMYAV